MDCGFVIQKCFRFCVAVSWRPASKSPETWIVFINSVEACQDVGLPAQPTAVLAGLPPG